MPKLNRIKSCPLAQSFSGYNTGTSIATPHAAGLYAVIKAAIPGVTVAVATEWIKQNATTNIWVVSGAGYTLPRIRVRDL